MSNPKIYNADHMTDVIAKYQQCEKNIENAITELSNTSTSFLANYKGQSDDMAPDLFAKTKEHMEFLKECFAQMGVFVTYTRDTAVATDKSLASGYSGGGGGGGGGGSR